MAALAVAIVAAGCGGSDVGRRPCGATAPSMEKTIPVSALPDGADAGAGQTTAEVVSRCQASTVYCPDLCHRALGAFYELLTCEVIGGDGGLAVHIIYRVACTID